MCLALISLPPGCDIFICSQFPYGHYLVWQVRVSFGVRADVRVIDRVSKLLGSDYGQREFRVRVNLVGVVVRPKQLTDPNPNPKTNPDP